MLYILYIFYTYSWNYVFIVFQLLKYVPTPEETQLLSEHEHDIDQMAKADRFLYEMSQSV